jgi:phage shock protein PspC (stress-responsive transcriptional regulator)
MPIKRLTRSPAEAKIGGVCAGLADYFEVDVVLVRTAWLVFSIVPGAIIGGVLAYLAAWLLIPERDAAAGVVDGGRRLTLAATDRKIAGVCGGIAEYFGIDSTAIRLLWMVLSIVFGAVIGGVIAYLAAWLIMPKPHTAAIVPSMVTPAA